MKALTSAIKNLKSLTTLYIGHNNIGTDGATDYQPH